MCCLEYNLKVMSKKAMAELIRNLVKDKEVIEERAQSYKKQMLEYKYFANKTIYRLSNAVDELKAKYDRLKYDYEDLSKRYCEVNKKYKVFKEELIDAIETKQNTHVFEYKPGEKPTYKMTKEEEDEWNLRCLMSNISDYEYEVIKPKKKRGALKCSDFRTCSGDNCPLKALSCQTCLCDDDEKTLYGILEKTRLHYGFDTDHPVYKAFKAELDKEVE